MATILIVDHTDWVIHFYSEVVKRVDIEISVTGDINSIHEKINYFNPDLVLMNLDLKDGSNPNIVSRNIKLKHPRLPVLLVSPYDTYLYDARRIRANTYFLKGCVSPKDLRLKIDSVLDGNPAEQKV